jgi:hypothetical protein
VTKNCGFWILWLGLFDVTSTLTLGCNSSHIQLLLDTESLAVVCILYFWSSGSSSSVCCRVLSPLLHFTSVIFDSRTVYKTSSRSVLFLVFDATASSILLAAGTEVVRYPLPRKLLLEAPLSRWSRGFQASRHIMNCVYTFQLISYF